jgi:hypothetical protein
MNKIVAAIVVVAIIVGGALGYRYWLEREGAGPPAQPAASGVMAAPVAPPPVTHYPVAEAPAAEPELPELDHSDDALAAGLTEVLGADAFKRLIVPQELARHFVAAVDNLPRSAVSSRIMPIRPLNSPLSVAADGDRLTIAPDNSGRYATYVNWVTRADTTHLVALYQRFYPLFQQAYEQLGYPKAYFNDRVIVAIDDMLAAPQPLAGAQLESAHVLYHFADPDLEARSAGQKIMMRLGPDNEARLKSKLRAIRRELTRAPPDAARP